MKALKVIGKFSALILAAATVLCCASCSDTSWAVKSGDKTVPAGVYLGFLTDGYLTAAYSVTDQNTDMFSQKIGDIKVADYIKNSAMDSSKQFLAVEKLFDEYKLSFTDKELTEINTNAKSFWDSYKVYYEDNGCGKQSYEKINLMSEKYQKIFEYYYSEDGKKPLSEKERKEYFSENYAKLKYFTVDYSAHFSGVTDSSEATDAQKTELKELTEKYITRLKAGESFDKIKAEEAKFSEEEDDEQKDAEAASTDPTFLTKDTSENPSAFNKAVFAAKIDEFKMIENASSGYYVFVRYATDANSKDYTDRAESVLSSMKSEEFSKVVEDYTKKLKFETNKAAISRYKPQNITLSF